MKDWPKNIYIALTGAHTCRPKHCGLVPIYVWGLDTQQQTPVTRAFEHGLPNVVAIEGPGIPRRKFVMLAPRFSIWLTVAEVIACLYAELEVAKFRS